MNRILISTILVLIFSQGKSQTIEIGQDANQIKRLIEGHTKDFNQPDSYGNRTSATASWDDEYVNGQIVSVVQCFVNQLHLDLNMYVNYCKHYIMKLEKLEYILTQYENVSTEKIRQIYNSNYSENKIDDYYFTVDYEHYSLIYLGNNGYATVEWRKTNTDLLPSTIKNSIQTKLQEKENEEYIKKLALYQKKLDLQKKESEKEKESKTSDIQENNISLEFDDINELIEKENFDQVLSIYEEMIQQYIDTVEKAKDDDVSAIASYMKLATELAIVSMKMCEIMPKLSKKQLERFNLIDEKYNLFLQFKEINN